MQFSLNQTLNQLENTPAVLKSMVVGIPTDMLTTKENEDRWSIKEVVAHLIICEKTNWLDRINIILYKGNNQPFVPIDMVIHFKLAQEKTFEELISEFQERREKAITKIRLLNLQPSDFNKTGLHPTLGKVNLEQLLATWATHDLSHLIQVSRILAKQYDHMVGPFKRYLNVLNT
ncbi:DinB family protein [Flavobacterium sp. UMI-01]|uniref:DinB family protein n=1 Tax=Flavobacterium sp. UMI-01 TaxID=1441053 RepID=UPI00207E8960|nr:DinB family protein [Flavobacterium sp. UMI-01]GIZ09016.1 hypothetical protein FUMI01_17430 [Flavobacterium sp. UMI-01]